MGWCSGTSWHRSTSWIEGADATIQGGRGIIRSHSVYSARIPLAFYALYREY